MLHTATQLHTRPRESLDCSHLPARLLSDLTHDDDGRLEHPDLYSAGGMAAVQDANAGEAEEDEARRPKLSHTAEHTC